MSIFDDRPIGGFRTHRQRTEYALGILLTIVVLGGICYGIVACDNAINKGVPQAQREQMRESVERHSEAP